MKLAYHTKTDTHGWHHVITAPIDAPDWHAQDVWAFNFMRENGQRVLTIGWNMYQLVEEKMTYLQKVKAELKDALERAENRAERIAEFRAHLDSPKFKQQADGERADWIATKDVLEWLNYINYFNE